MYCLCFATKSPRLSEIFPECEMNFRSLLLAKITFWQVCYSVCLSVCLFVCLFVTLSHHISRTNRQIITKLGPHMELGTAKRPIVFGVDDVTNDVIRSKSRSNFKIAISQPIFKLQRRNKNWNAALIMGHYSVMVNFRCHFRCFRFNIKFWHQNGGHFQNPCCVLDSLILTSDMKTT